MAKAKVNPENMPNEIENISKIRDILFGNNMNEYEKRFEQLESKLAQSLEENKIEAEKRISTLDTYMKKEFKMLSDRLIEEEESRIKSDKKLLMDIETLEESFKKFKQLTTENFSDNHQQLMDLSNSTTEQINALNKALQARLETTSNQLQSNKVERSSLAMMLTDLAYQIAGENEAESAESQDQ